MGLLKTASTDCKLILVLCILMLIACKPSAENVVEAPPEISSTLLKEHVTILASDSLEGRGAGYKGGELAAQYIAQQFNKIGLHPIQDNETGDQAYFQPFSFHTLQSPVPWETRKSQNVLAVLKGSHYPDEYLVVGGHHDGQGLPGQADFGRDLEGVVSDSIALKSDRIWNSAVDNAVSIAAIMEIARVLSLSENLPKRSIIFSTFSAEESGLDGSTHFVNHPPFPLDRIKAMVNLEKIVGDPEAPFLYVSYGTNPIFEKLQKRTDSLHKMELIPFYPGMIANSDHYAFGQRKIPAITMGTGSEINVHTPLDHADHLDYELLEQRSNYILSYLKQLADSDSSFEFTGELAGLLGVSGGQATAVEKSQKGFEGAAAFKVTTVVKDSKGDAAGLKPGDLIISIDNQTIKYQQFYQGLEGVMEETSKEKVILKLIRGTETMEVGINLSD